MESLKKVVVAGLSGRHGKLAEVAAERSSAEKGGLTMSKRILIGMMVMVFGFAGLYAGEAFEDIDVYVTPIVTEALTASPTYYNFGSLDIGTSSNSVTALTLENTGQVGINIEKCVDDDGAWDVTASSTATNGFDFWAQCKTARPALADYTSGNTHDFNETALDTYNNLTDDAGTQVSLGVDATASLWFRIDMPAGVTTSDQQRIDVKLKAIGN